MNSRDFGLLVAGEVFMQFSAQHVAVKVALQHTVDLGHLLAFKLDPALLLEIIQRLHHPISLCRILRVHRLETHGCPGSRTARRLDDRRDKLPAFALETFEQRVRLQQVFETVFGVVRVARRDKAAQLQLHQQCLERQRADIALIRERTEQKFPLPFRHRGFQLIEHIADTLALRCVAVNEVFQHVEAVAIGQHQTIRRLPVTPRAAYFLAVVFDGFGQVEVHHIADVALVDAHAESDGRDDAIGLPGHEAFLDRLALIVG